MKTKTYVFTENEIFIIRDALIEYYQNEFKDADCDDRKLNLIALKNQFKDDARLI